MTTTYTKLKNGDWGIRSAINVTAGASLTVSKRDGSTKEERVARKIWGDDSRRVYIYAIERSGGYSSRRGGSGSSQYPWTGCSCGSREGLPRPSDCASCQHDY